MNLLARRGRAARAGFPESRRGWPVTAGCWGHVEGGCVGAWWGPALGWVHPNRALQDPMALQNTVPGASPAPDGHRCSEPRLAFPTRQTEVSSSLLYPSPCSPLTKKKLKKSPPFQAAICLFCWTRNLLKCLSMDEGTQSRRTEPGRLHGEWKIVFWDFLEFEGLMMDVHAKDGNGFVSIKTQSKRITLPNRLRNVRRTGSALL